MPTTKKKEEQNQLPVQNVSNQSQTQQTGNGYQSKWQPQINDLMGQYLNRDQFKYDVNEDALYQQMKDMYVMQGQKAMMDTMGQTTALTGGYGNSWAQGAGQQAYQGYLQQLNDNIPDLYQMALNQYMNEGDQIAQNIGMMMDQEGIDYGRYRDQMADQEDAYNKLVALMENYHYEPTAEELAAAGMPVAHKNAIMKPYYDALAAARAAKASSGGGGSSGGRGSGGGGGGGGLTEDEETAYNYVVNMWNNAVEGGSSRFNPYTVVKSTNQLTSSQKTAAEQIIKEFESTGAFKNNKKLS